VRLVFIVTGSGAAVLTMLTSLCVGEATTTVVEALLLLQFGSLTAEQGTLILAVLVMLVPDAVVRFTLTLMLKLTLPAAPTAMLFPRLSVQVTVPVAPTA